MGTLLRVLGVVSKAEEVVLVLHYIGLCQLQSLKTLRGPFRDEGALANIGAGQQAAYWAGAGRQCLTAVWVPFRVHHPDPDPPYSPQ